MLRIEDAFREGACKGWLCAEGADTATEVSGDEPVVAASVIKVLIALAAESAFVAGDLDPVQPIRLSSLRRTPGPVGFSLFADDVIASSRDLVSAMLTISDNVAPTRYWIWLASKRAIGWRPNLVLRKR